MARKGDFTVCSCGNWAFNFRIQRNGGKCAKCGHRWTCTRDHLRGARRGRVRGIITERRRRPRGPRRSTLQHFSSSLPLFRSSPRRSTRYVRRKR
eukprot:2146216-Pyramimonas_sp.AAC.1